MISSNLLKSISLLLIERIVEPNIGGNIFIDAMKKLMDIYISKEKEQKADLFFQKTMLITSEKAIDNIHNFDIMY